MAGSNFNSKFDKKVEIIFTNNNKLAIFAECFLDPNIYAIEKDKYANGCIMKNNTTPSDPLWKNIGDEINPIWSPIGGIVPPTTQLSDLSDVSITSPLNKDLLIYNTLTSKWENGTITTDDVIEGINQYFTVARAIAATSGSYDVFGSSSTALLNANAYTDSEITLLKAYVDLQDAATLLSANNYTDTQDAATLLSANNYTDGEITTLKTYVDTQDAATLLSANNYTDGEITTLKTYVDTQDAATLLSANNYTDNYFDIFNTVFLRDDFISANTASDLAWANAVAGAGATVAFVSTNLDINHPGILQFTTGTTATGRSGNNLGLITVLPKVGMKLKEVINIPILSTPTQRFIVRTGLGDNIAGDHTDGVYFEYDESISPNWRICTAATSIRTKTTTSIPVVANTWIKLETRYTVSGIEFFIDGVSAGVITTNIPTVAQTSGPLTHIIKSIGLTSRNFLKDAWSLLIPVTR